MTRYIKSFQNAEAIQEAVNNEELLKPYVAYNESAATIDYNTKINYTKEPLTFEITSAGTICWKTTSSDAVTIEYSKNGGDWTEITSTTEGVEIPVVSGDTVQFRGNNTKTRNSIFGDSTAKYKVKGNIMSLLSKENFESLNTLQNFDEYTFANLFSSAYYLYNTGLTDASQLILPATTLTKSCYYYMFSNCTSLTAAPALPATTLADNCYSGMFAGTNVLPDCSNIDFTSATVLASGGLKGLFSGTKVTDNDLRQILPINPNTNKYYLPVTTLANFCYTLMFNGCRSLTTAPELPATTLARYCYQSMFQDCTSLTTAPELPATTLADSCYRTMFNNCTSLNYIKCLATDISATNSTWNWVSNVSSTGTFIKAAGVSWTTGISGIPTGWTVEEI